MDLSNIIIKYIQVVWIYILTTWVVFWFFPDTWNTWLAINSNVEVAITMTFSIFLILLAIAILAVIGVVLIVLCFFLVDQLDNFINTRWQ